jgi:hypothetical protein
VWLGGVNFSGLQAESIDAKSNNNPTKHKSKLLIKKRGKKWRGKQKGDEMNRRKQLLLTELQLNLLSLAKTHVFFLQRRCCCFFLKSFFVSFFSVPLGNIAHNFKS